MRVHSYTLGTAIERTPEFEKKGLAEFAVNPGTKCGHDCAYCSTGPLLRLNKSFKVNHESPFERGYAICDPDMPERVARDAKNLKTRGLIQLCTQVDAWSEEAQAHDLGRRCLEAILNEPGWSVRILTKNAAVVRDFDLVERYRDRVIVGLSITGPPDSSRPVAALEPYASSIEERIAALEEAHRRGLRVFGMFCPLSPGIGDSKSQVDWLVKFGERIGVEEIFIEPVNLRGRSFSHCVNALNEAQFPDLASRLDAVRRKKYWSPYTRKLIATAQASVKEHSDLAKLRILTYSYRLTQEDFKGIKRFDEGVIWLLNDKEKLLGKGGTVKFMARLERDINREIERQVTLRVKNLKAKMDTLQKLAAKLSASVDSSGPAKNVARRRITKVKKIKRPIAAGKVCPICGFATDPAHDRRAHRSQAEKRAFSDQELGQLKLKKSGAIPPV